MLNILFVFFVRLFERCFSQTAHKQNAIAKKNATENLLLAGLKYHRTQLGEACFIPAKTTSPFADKIFFPTEWSKAEIKAIADYLDAFPECTLFKDGSGQKHK